MTTNSPQKHEINIPGVTLNSKGNLARMLAAENLTVKVDPKVRTASFDMAKRTLSLPNYVGMSNNTIDALVGHEIAHAMYTPGQGWSQTIDSMTGKDGDEARKIATHFLNVCEDARIDGRIKNRYPGLKVDYRLGWAELHNKHNIFGIKGIPDAMLGKLSFIDRLNLHAKLGVNCGVNIPFNAAEQKLVDRVMGASTFDDTAAIANELYQEWRRQNDPPPSQGGGQGKGQGGGKGQSQGQSGGGKSAKSGNGQGQNGAPQANGKGQSSGQSGNNPSQGGGGGGSNNQPQGGGGSQGGEDEQPQGDGKGQNEKSQDGEDKEDGDNQPQGANDDKDGDQEGDGDAGDQEGDDDSDQEGQNGEDGETDEAPDMLGDGNLGQTVNAADGGLAKLAAVNGNSTGFFNLPTMNLDTFIKDADWFNERFKNLAPNVVTALRAEFNAAHGDSVNLMVQEFNRYRAADEYRRTGTAKTGALSTSKLSHFKYSEDIFRRITVTSKGENHGLVIVLDWSGSMDSIVYDTMIQMVILTEFCSKAGIDFDVYAFADSVESSTADHIVKHMPDDCFPIMGCERLVHMIGSGLAPATRRKCRDNLLGLAEAYRRAGGVRKYTGPTGFNLGGTPLNAAIVGLYDVVKAFRERTKAQIVHTVIMTDGGATDNNWVQQTLDSQGNPIRHSSRVDWTQTTIRHPQTKMTIRGDAGGNCGMTGLLLYLLESATGTNNTCIYFNSPSAYAKTKEEKELVDRERFYHATHHAGYTNYYVLSPGTGKGIIRRGASRTADEIISDAKAARASKNVFRAIARTMGLKNAVNKAKK